MSSEVKETKNLGFSDTDYKKFMKYATRMLFGFSIMYMFFYNGRQNMSLAIPMMIEEFNVTSADMGIVTSSLFWCYGFGHLFSGRLGEVFGNRRFIIWGVVLSAIINFVISFQASLISIAILWGINGFAQSMVWSPGIALSAKWWPSTRRGYASGVMTGFSGIAQIVTWLSILAAFYISPNWGWRAAFRIPLIPMVLILILFIAIVKDNPKDVGLEDYKEESVDAAELEAERMKILKEKGKLYPYIALLKEPKFIVFMLIIAIGSIGRYGLLTWVPLYFVEVLGFEVKSGIFSSVVLPIGQALGFFLMPTISDKVFKGRREPLLIICGIIAATSLVVFPLLTSKTAASVALLFVGFFSSVNGLIWAFAGDIGTRAFAGTATGILDWAAYMAAAVQAIIFGRVSAAGNWTVVFATIAILYVIMVILALKAGKMKPRGSEA